MKYFNGRIINQNDLLSVSEETDYPTDCLGARVVLLSITYGDGTDHKSSHRVVFFNGRFCVGACALPDEAQKFFQECAAHLRINPANFENSSRWTF